MKPKNVHCETLLFFNTLYFGVDTKNMSLIEVYNTKSIALSMMYPRCMGQFIQTNKEYNHYKYWLNT